MNWLARGLTILVLGASTAWAEPAATSAGDPLSEARAGKIVCYEPQPDTRECSGIYQFSFAADGSISMLNQGVIRDSDGLIYRMHERIFVVHGQFCMPWDPDAQRLATYRRGGMPLDAEATARINESMVKVFDLEPGTLFCMTPRREGDLWRNDLTTGGGPPERGTRPYAWVDPAEGWRLQGE